MVFVGSERLRAPLHDQLPSPEGYTSLPRYPEVDLCPLVVMFVEDRQRDRSEKGEHVLRVPQLFPVTVPWVPQTLQQRPTVRYRQRVSVRDRDRFESGLDCLARGFANHGRLVNGRSGWG